MSQMCLWKCILSRIAPFDSSSISYLEHTFIFLPLNTELFCCDIDREDRRPIAFIWAQYEKTISPESFSWFSFFDLGSYYGVISSLSLSTKISGFLLLECSLMRGEPTIIPWEHFGTTTIGSLFNSTVKFKVMRVNFLLFAQSVCVSLCSRIVTLSRDLEYYTQTIATAHTITDSFYLSRPKKEW